MTPSSFHESWICARSPLARQDRSDLNSATCAQIIAAESEPYLSKCIDAEAAAGMLVEGFSLHPLLAHHSTEYVV